MRDFAFQRNRIKLPFHPARGTEDDKTRLFAELRCDNIRYRCCAVASTGELPQHRVVFEFADDERLNAVLV